MFTFYTKLKAIWVIITVKAQYGILIFTEVPTQGDTITIGNMKATFQKNDD